MGLYVCPLVEQKRLVGRRRSCVVYSYHANNGDTTLYIVPPKHMVFALFPSSSSIALDDIVTQAHPPLKITAQNADTTLTGYIDTACRYLYWWQNVYTPQVARKLLRNFPYSTGYGLDSLSDLELFKVMNDARYRENRLLWRVMKRGVTDGEPEGINESDNIASYTRNMLVERNLALVLAMAKRTKITGVSFEDLVAEGNLALYRAVDKFDYTRGFKFSTYACRAILRAFGREAGRQARYSSYFRVQYDPNLEKSSAPEESAYELGEQLTLLTDALRNPENPADLTPSEKAILHHRFSLNSGGKPLTLEQTGQIIGVSKERVRQLQKRSIKKLQEYLSQ